MASDQTLRTYDESADRMAVKFRAMGPRSADIDRIFQHIGKESPNVLEIGCGDGRDALEFRKRTSNYLGIDYSEGMLKMAREYVPNAEFRLADVSEFEFPEGLDGIAAFASLLHLPPEKVRSVVNRGYEALNPGWVFCVSLKKWTGSDSKTDEFGTRTYFYYEPEDILSFLPEGVRSETVITEIRGQTFFETFLLK